MTTDVPTTSADDTRSLDTPAPSDREPTADGPDAPPSRVAAMDARELVETYTGLVVKLTQQIYQRCSESVSFDDLRAYGFLGLLQAHRRFDPDAEARFASFAYLRVRGAILDGLRDATWSKRHWELEVDVCTRDADTSDDAHAPTRSALPTPPSTESDETESSGRRTSSRSLNILLMNRLDLDQLAEPGSETPREECARHQALSHVERAIDALDERQYRVLVQYYIHDRSMSEIAEQRDCTKSWVSRLHGRAIEVLRNELRERGVRVEPSA